MREPFVVLDIETGEEDLADLGAIGADAALGRRETVLDAEIAAICSEDSVRASASDERRAQDADQ